MATRRALLGVVVPMWLGSGALDWWFHRRTRIEQTAGAHESILHLAMLAEAGVPSMLGLFLEVNAGVLIAAWAGLIAHQATAMWDVHYADKRRRVPPGEQHAHSFLEVGPMVGALLLTVMHWDQAQAAVGRGLDRPDFRLRLKSYPLPAAHIGMLLTAVTCFGVVPFLEELWRCLRTHPTLDPQPH
ncbi:MAG: hypothetical protein NVSMB2_27400 [Chloroflexota bacterium]